MKTLAMTLMVIWSVFQLAAAQPQTENSSQWMTDLQKAQAKAQAENKMVLINFTGSDWCPYCVMLDKKVFSSPEFQKYAKEKLVLVEVDFPRNKPQPEALAAANKQLSEKYKVEGFPTIVVLDSQGKEINRETGYSGESPKQYIAKLDQLAAKKTASASTQ